MHVSITYNVSYLCSTLSEIEKFTKVFVKFSSIKFRENPSSGSRLVTRMGGRTDRAIIIRTPQ